MSTQKRILIIDDDDVTRRLAAHIFTKAGYNVFAAKNGAEGLAKVDNIRPDLVVLDVMMPDMSGLEVCKKLRANPETAWLPIIMLSAKSTVDDVLEGFQSGADDYVGKPVSHKELLARANALLQRAGRMQQSARARVIAAVGVKGGTGVTTTLVNIAALLASRQRSVILAELLPHRGNVTHHLHLSPAEDLGDLLHKSAAELRPADILRRVVRHKSGIRALIAPRKALDYVLTEAHVHLILETLISDTEYLLLDLSRVVGSGVQLALESADQIMLVLEPEVVSIACAREDLEMLKAWGLFDRTGLLIISRCRSSNLVAPKEIEQKLNSNIIGVIPPSADLFYLTADIGQPVVISKPNTLPAESLIKLADELLERLPVDNLWGQNAS